MRVSKRCHFCVNFLPKFSAKNWLAYFTYALALYQIGFSIESGSRVVDRLELVPFRVNIVSNRVTMSNSDIA